MNLSWRQHAACRGLDPEIFYPVTDEDADEAKAVCAGCAVRQTCLEYTLAHARRKACGAVPPSANAAASSASAAEPRDPASAADLTFEGWPAVLGPLTRGPDLTARRGRGAAMAEILAGDATPAQIAGFIVALRMKGETVDELTGLLDAMLAASERVDAARSTVVVDIVGTGGDRSHSINVSTLAALVVAGAGGRCASTATAPPRRRAAAPTCSRRSASASTSAGGRGPLRRRGRHRVLLRAAVPPGHAPRRADPPRAGGADGVQHPRTDGQPGPGAAATRRRRRPVHGRADGRGAAGPRRRAGVDRHGDDGLDELTITTTSNVVEVVDAGCGRLKVDPVELGLQPARRKTSAAATRPPTPAWPGPCWPATPGPHRDIVRSTPAPASSPPASPTISRRAWRPRGLRYHHRLVVLVAAASSLLGINSSFTRSSPFASAQFLLSANPDRRGRP